MELTKPVTAFLVCLMVACQIAAAPTNHNEQQSQELGQSGQPANSNVTVQTSSGLLVGLETPLTTFAGESSSPAANQSASIIKFLAVPYAQAPIGELRFKRPLELTGEQAQQIVDATHYGKTCPQFRHLARFVSPLLNLDHEHQISEDCLQLNVFVPSFVNGGNGDKHLEPNKQLPVIVWLPGEGFDYADARQFDGSHLAHKTQSIVVTVQYRVGILGFLDSRSSELSAPGNMAIHDQLMALRWVRRNINVFGGDHERVTLMGRFSGSMTISAMLTAPNQNLIKSELDGRSLFKRAILMSGIAVDDWIIEEDQGEKVAGVLALARERNYCTKSQLLDGSCLQTMPVDKLLEISGFGWKLVRDQQLIGRHGPIEAVRHNKQMLSSDVEAILLGETESEGTLCLYRHMLTRAQSNYAQLIEENRLTSGDLYDIIRDDSLTYFKFNVSASPNPIQMALEALMTTSDENSADSNGNGGGLEGAQNNDLASQAQQGKLFLREKYLDACSSYMVKAHNLRIKRHIQANNMEQERNSLAQKPVELYHYELKYKPTFSLAPDYIKTAAHGDDVPLVFGLVYNQPRANVDPSDLAMTQKMMAYIGNFVHGNQPLLQQHNQVDTAAGVGAGAQQQPENSNPAVIATRRSGWTSGEQIHHLELSESDLIGGDLNTNGIRRHHHLRPVLAAAAAPPAAAASGAQGTFNLRLFIVDSYQPAQQQQQVHQPPQQLHAPVEFGGAQSTLALLLSTSLVVLALMSLCIALSVLVIRCNVVCASKRGNHLIQPTSQKQQQHFKSPLTSASPCDVCDDSQASAGGTHETNKKNECAFSNVFAKLKGQHQHQGQQQQQHCNGQTTIPQQHRQRTDASELMMHPVEHGHQ